MNKNYNFYAIILFLLLPLFINSKVSGMVLDDIPSPMARSGTGMIYDPINHDIILFSGMKDNYNLDGSYLNDTWKYSYSENKWTEIHSTNRPTSRNSPAMVFDPTKERVILYGGINQNEFLNDTWELDLETYEWLKIETDVSPGLIADSEMVFDELNQEIVLFGGHWQFGYFDETWIFDVNENTWTKLNVSIHPSERYGHRMVYSTKKQSIILFAGHAFNVTDTVNNDMWIYNCSNKQWSEIIIDPVPPIRYWHDIAYDEVNEKIVLFGGRINWYSMNCRNDTWEFIEETNEWIEITAEDSPTARMFFSMVYHEKEKKIFLFGGNQDPYTMIYDDLWIYDTELSQWSLIDLSTKPANFPFVSVLAVVILLNLTSFISRKQKRK